MIDVKCTVCDATDGDVEITVRLVQGKDQIVVRPIGKDRTEHREFVGVLSLAGEWCSGVLWVSVILCSPLLENLEVQTVVKLMRDGNETKVETRRDNYEAANFASTRRERYIESD